jgi:hypothetical protein
MAELQDDSMPPRPDVEFDFNLPHGIDTEDDGNREQQLDDSVDYDHSSEKLDSPEDVYHTSELNNGKQDLNYGILPKGFSDDEAAGEAFDRSWSGHQARKSPYKNKKPPKRSSEDGDDEASPTGKKPRQSLFGGSAEEDEEEQPDDYPIEQDNDDIHGLKTPGHCIGNRISSLNLEQPEREISPSERQFNLGFGLATLDRGSMSPTPAPDPSEESIIIPPDTQVSVSSI